MRAHRNLGSLVPGLSLAADRAFGDLTRQTLLDQVFDQLVGGSVMLLYNTVYRAVAADDFGDRLTAQTFGQDQLFKLDNDVSGVWLPLDETFWTNRTYQAELRRDLQGDEVW